MWIWRLAVDGVATYTEITSTMSLDDARRLYDALCLRDAMRARAEKGGR